MKFIIFMMFVCGVLSAEDELYKAAKNRLEKTKHIDLIFGSGFSGEPSRNNVAMLVILSKKEKNEFFMKLTETPGIQAAYGLIGLKYSDPTGKFFRKRFQHVLKRDGAKEVETVVGDVIAREKMMSFLARPEGENPKINLKAGEYIFSNLSLEEADSVKYVVENGLLCESLLNPWADAVALLAKKKDALPLEKDEKTYLELGEKIADEKLIHKNPMKILKMIGFENNEDILRYLKK